MSIYSNLVSCLASNLIFRGLLGSDNTEQLHQALHHLVRLSAPVNEREHKLARALSSFIEISEAFSLHESPRRAVPPFTSTIAIAFRHGHIYGAQINIADLPERPTTLLSEQCSIFRCASHNLCSTKSADSYYYGDQYSAPYGAEAVHYFKMLANFTAAGLEGKYVRDAFRVLSAIALLENAMYDPDRVVKANDLRTNSKLLDAAAFLGITEVDLFAYCMETRSGGNQEISAIALKTKLLALGTDLYVSLYRSIANCVSELLCPVDKVDYWVIISDGNAVSMNDTHPDTPFEFNETNCVNRFVTEIFQGTLSSQSL